MKPTDGRSGWASRRSPGESERPVLQGATQQVASCRKRRSIPRRTPCGFIPPGCSCRRSLPDPPVQLSGRLFRCQGSSGRGKRCRMAPADLLQGAPLREVLCGSNLLRGAPGKDKGVLEFAWRRGCVRRKGKRLVSEPQFEGRILHLFPPLEHHFSCLYNPGDGIPRQIFSTGLHCRFSLLQGLLPRYTAAGLNVGILRSIKEKHDVRFYFSR